MSSIHIQRVANVDERSLPVFAEIDELMGRIRERAHECFAARGGIGEQALDDWLTAERELCWPAAELTERDDAYVLNVSVAGFEPDEITVTATPRELIIQAAHTAERAGQTEVEGKVRWSEFRRSDVCRRVELPLDMQVDTVAATFRNGLLRIVAPKAEITERQPTRIEISEAA